MKRFVFCLMFFLFVNLVINAQQSELKKPKVGLVLSGGGAKGLAHIGVIKVLEKAGIKIDYIGGTSMGSIIGGLYAMGYSADQLDSIVRNLDWEKILTDKISRQNLSMIEKDEDVKYMISFPIREKKISLPSGIVTGQNISNTFACLCAPVYNITDFSKLPIPFFCIAVDIEKGQEVILKEGNLAEAMRASMAIPTVFTPEKINDQVLVDGGLINNFPVKIIKDMGADIIIGVDVGFNYSKKHETNSMMKIIEQSIFMHGRELNSESRKLCDVLITPDLSGFNISSFTHSDSLIARGERAAMEVYDSILLIAQRIGSSSSNDPLLLRNCQKSMAFLVKKVEIQGLENVPENFLLRKLSFSIPSKINTDEIENNIQKIYGTWFFERVTYSFVPYEDGVKLIFNVIEKTTNLFRAGLHYDNDYKATLALNTTFRNSISKGSKISLDLALGENPSFSALYYKNSGWNPKYGLFFWSKLIPDYGVRVQAHSLEVYDYISDKKVGSLGFNDVTTDFFIQGNISNNSVFGFGAVSDYTSISSRISNTHKYDQNSYFFNLYGFYKIDSYNESFFPTKGVKLSGEIKYNKGISKSVSDEKFFLQATLRANFVQKISKRISISEGVNAGSLFTDTAPSQYWYYMGGLSTNQLRGSMSFAGVKFMQRTGNHVCVLNFQTQWEMWDNNFLTLKTNAGKATRERKNMFEPDDILVGYGISYGYRSPIGPMEVTAMSSNKNPGISLFVSIGYWF